jgi:hypothetical protein
VVGGIVAIRILIGATLPGAIRIGKEDLDREPLSQALILGHLFASIIGQGFAQQRGHVPAFLREALAGPPRIRPLHTCQEDQERRPLHPGADGRAIASPLDQVAVAGHPAGRELRQGVRSSASYGGSGPVGLLPALEVGVPCAPDVAPPAVRSSVHRVAAHTGPHRSSPPTAVSPCREDTRV